VNATRAEHIITIEDPIEFLHRDKKGYGQPSREDPKSTRRPSRRPYAPLSVGSGRDPGGRNAPTWKRSGTAIHAAETGHMVFSTLHTLDAVENHHRIIAVFPPPRAEAGAPATGGDPARHHQQRLVKRADTEGRVPAVEVMINTAFIRECILVPEKDPLRFAMPSPAGTSQYGMQTFDQSFVGSVPGKLDRLRNRLSRTRPMPTTFKATHAGYSRRLADISTAVDAVGRALGTVVSAARNVVLLKSWGGRQARPFL